MADMKLPLNANHLQFRYSEDGRKIPTHAAKKLGVRISQQPISEFTSPFLNQAALTANTGQGTESRMSWATLPKMSFPTAERFRSPMISNDT